MYSKSAVHRISLVWSHENNETMRGTRTLTASDAHPTRMRGAQRRSPMPEWWISTFIRLRIPFRDGWSGGGDPEYVVRCCHSTPCDSLLSGARVRLRFDHPKLHPWTEFSSVTWHTNDPVAS